DAVNCIGFHPDGLRVATGHDECLRLWDLPSRTLLFEHRLDALARCAALEFSPDGARVAARVCHGPHESSSVLVLDGASGKVLGSAQCRKEEWSAGHEARWSEDSNRLWFACLQEKAPLMELTLETPAPRMLQYLGRAPRSGKPGLAFATTVGSILALDESTGNCRWNRPNLSRAGEILKTSTGHFTTDLESLEELWVDTCAQGDLTPLADLVTQLFDPKRVRAARAGIAIVPVKFSGVKCSR
ncbi:MAG TPA: hypothetical protein VM509_12135, partial [Planctomycetota bacterium]|nr:hypothetical protein [Planctomycetota bacterium]